MEETKRLGPVIWIAAVLFLLFGLGPKPSTSHVAAASETAANGTVENSDGATGQANQTRFEAEGDQPTCLPSEGFTCAASWAEFLRIPPYYYGVTLLLWKDKDSFVQVVTSEWEVYLWRGRSDDK